MGSLGYVETGKWGNEGSGTFGEFTSLGKWRNVFGEFGCLGAYGCRKIPLDVVRFESSFEISRIFYSQVTAITLYLVLVCLHKTE